MTPLPIRSVRPSTIATIENLPAFLMIKQKAYHAEIQKALLVRALWIQAFLVMNLTHLLIHQIKHLRQLIIILDNVFYGIIFSYFFLTYSNTIYSISTMAMTRAPNDTVPRWYLTLHQIDCETLAYPLLSLLLDPAPEKYHWQVVHAVIKSATPLINAAIQKSPNK